MRQVNGEGDPGQNSAGAALGGKGGGTSPGMGASRRCHGSTGEPRREDRSVVPDSVLARRGGVTVGFSDKKVAGDLGEDCF